MAKTTAIKTGSYKVVGTTILHNRILYKENGCYELDAPTADELKSFLIEIDKETIQQEILTGVN